MIFDAVLSSSPSLTSFPVLQGIENGKRTWHITLKEDPGESSAPIQLDKAWHVRFLCKVGPEQRGIKIRKDCEVIEPLNGKIKLELGPEEMDHSGMWWGAIQILDKDDVLLEQFQCWLMIKQALTEQPKHNKLTVGDVRAFLFDRCAEDNRLLASVQFRDDQIMNAMQLAVDEFNSTPPDVAYFTTVNFPWKTEWLKGTAAYLLRSEALRQIRNQASYQTGTVTVNDSDKGPILQQLGDSLYHEWIDWVKAKKRQINIAIGWGGNIFIEF
jgi:hypothetical protein